MAQMRDEKGRFCKATTNNTLNNEKEKAMNKTNTREARMNTLKENGVNIDNFFDLSLRIPLNAEVKISVNGKEMTIGQPYFQPGISSGGDYALTDCYDGVPVVNGVANYGVNNAHHKVDLIHLDGNEIDKIAQSIMGSGYIRNSKLFRRWITAHTFRLLNYQSYKNPNRKGWEAGLKDCYSYGYQFEMMLEEMRVLSILQKEDPDLFEERTHFFNGDVVVATLNDYLWRLKKYVNKQTRNKPRAYKGKPYVKLARYGNVTTFDLYDKVYNPINKAITNVKAKCNTGNYKEIYESLKDFMDHYYNKLPYETTKCSTWKDAFKGAGAFYSLQNLVRFHECFIKDENGIKWEGIDADIYLSRLLETYKCEVWRFHKVLNDVITYNNFDLCRSIAEGHNAPDTSVARRHERLNR